MSSPPSKWARTSLSERLFFGNKESNRLAGIQNLEDALKEMEKEASGCGDI